MSFPIDLVYTWVEDTPQHQQRRHAYVKRGYKQLPSLKPMRFRSNNELYESIKSALTYLPWLHHIYVVVDDLQHPCIESFGDVVSIIKHSLIFPAHHLPTFNSHAIESNLYKIPNLSEHFIYANDDVFFGTYLEKTQFFDNSGRPLIVPSAVMTRSKIRYNTMPYLAARWNSVLLLEHKFGSTKKFYFPAHQAKALTKELFRYAWDDPYFGHKLAQTSSSKFRSKHDIEPVGLMCGIGQALDIMGTIKLRCMYISLSDTTNLTDMFSRIRKKRPQLYCINDVMVNPSPRHIALYRKGLKSLPHANKSF